MKTLPYLSALLISLLTLACTPEDEPIPSNPPLEPVCPAYEEPSCEGDGVRLISSEDDAHTDRHLTAVLIDHSRELFALFAERRV